MMPECQEYFGALPFSSDHLWNAEIHGLPHGGCVKCGLQIYEYRIRSTNAFNALPPEEWMRHSVIGARFLNDQDQPSK